jgi:hypothetical protein
MTFSRAVVMKYSIFWDITPCSPMSFQASADFQRTTCVIPHKLHLFIFLRVHELVKKSAWRTNKDETKSHVERPIVIPINAVYNSVFEVYLVYRTFRKIKILPLSCDLLFVHWHTVLCFLILLATYGAIAGWILGHYANHWAAYGSTQQVSTAVML